ncbi:MAG: hypothetical protein AVDCRST_MAG16-1396, partial [uncultured Frankineae bacterium]
CPSWSTPPYGCPCPAASSSTSTSGAPAPAPARSAWRTCARPRAGRSRRSGPTSTRSRSCCRAPCTSSTTAGCSRSAPGRPCSPAPASASATPPPPAPSTSRCACRPSRPTPSTGRT